MNLTNKYLSHSQLYTYSQCGLKYKFRYSDGHYPPTTSPNLIFGDAIHTALEHFHRSQDDTLCSKSDMFEAFELRWFHLSSKPDIKWLNGVQKDNLYEIGIDTLDKYYDIHKDGPPPLRMGVYDDFGVYHVIPAVEISFEIEREGKPPIRGIIDLITTDENGPLIIDHKTTAKMYTDFQIKTNNQLVIYSQAFKQMVANGDVIGYGNPKHSVGFNLMLKKTKEKQGVISLIKRKITPNEVNKFNLIFDDMVKGVEADIFMPNYGMQCGYCDYRDICIEHEFEEKEV